MRNAHKLQSAHSCTQTAQRLTVYENKMTTLSLNIQPVFALK